MGNWRYVWSRDLIGCHVLLLKNPVDTSMQIDLYTYKHCRSVDWTDMKTLHLINRLLLIVEYIWILYIPKYLSQSQNTLVVGNFGSDCQKLTSVDKIHAHTQSLVSFYQSVSDFQLNWSVFFCKIQNEWHCLARWGRAWSWSKRYIKPFIIISLAELIMFFWILPPLSYLLQDILSWTLCFIGHGPCLSLKDFVLNRQTVKL